LIGMPKAGQITPDCSEHQACAYRRARPSRLRPSSVVWWGVQPFFSQPCHVRPPTIPLGHRPVSDQLRSTSALRIVQVDASSAVGQLLLSFQDAPFCRSKTDPFGDFRSNPDTRKCAHSVDPPQYGHLLNIIITPSLGAYSALGPDGDQQPAVAAAQPVRPEQKGVSMVCHQT
jgi:hypothetical protein